MTFERFNEDELLAYIEGELAPDEASRLERSLAESPRAAELVSHMQRDRERLRSEREPILPRDFISTSPDSPGTPSRIESRLARPMLMESMFDSTEDTDGSAIPARRTIRPGEMRRRHRRQVRRMRLMKLATAAIVTLAVGAGIWSLGVMTNLNEQARQWYAAMRSPNTADQQRTDHSPSGRGDENASDLPEDAARDWPSDVVVHHALPSGTAAPPGRPALDHARAAPDSALHDAPLDVLLVIRADDAATAESALAELIDSLDVPAALVQNFSYEEAARLAEAWSQGRSSHAEGAPRRSPSIAETGDRSSPRSREALSRMATEAQQQLQRMRSAAPSQSPANRDQSQQLAGMRELAPTFEDQLEYSSRGATHTIAVRAGALHEFLAAVDRASIAGAALVPLPDGDSAAAPGESAAAGNAWLSHRRDVQRFVARIIHMPDEAVIHLPVRIEPSSARP